MLGVLGMEFFLGCAVWSYKGWIGELFPSGSRSADFLRLYSQRFTAVEGNTTFYQIPTAETISRWVAETPTDFQFCPKLPRQLSHQGLLQPQISGAVDFLTRMQPLGSRLGPTFIQLPPHYSPEQRQDLLSFLQALPRQDFALALEVRHPDWFQEYAWKQLAEDLSRLGVGSVLLDSRPIYQTPADARWQFECRKPELPLQPRLTADFGLIRFISHPHQPANQPFLQEWVDWIQQRGQQQIKVYFLVHCPIEAHSPGNARYFQQLLEQRGVPVNPLPWERFAAPATQLSLFG